ncbi:hypothetical protein K435DRAFT_682719 [Dendrothele bispora CBS 962.96]|uniref:Berberine/berberine-like domain-containing protein n=1 Tax=Dendrothele bispora (strain CBS 962.96) TaxID=1314807 RepID=A0A4S8LDQ7_DENBC|nr:hypothetical protein K435DRAFT_682719 [Dendrothele bispora CBS 962.96]
MASEAIEEQVDLLYKHAVADNKEMNNVLFSIEPFNMPFAHSTDSAYPHPSNRQVTPSTPTLFYVNPEDDTYFENALRRLVNAVQTVAVNEGESSWDNLYCPNYALADTPLVQMYGSNVDRLRKIRERVDPDNIMLLTGGFKFV